MSDANAIVPNDGVQDVLVFDLLDQAGFNEWMTPMYVSEDDHYNEDLYPDGIGECPHCGGIHDHVFNMTNTVDGVSWTLRSCWGCTWISFTRSVKWSPEGRGV